LGPSPPSPGELAVKMTPGRRIVVIIVIAVALTWLNLAYYKHRVAVLTAPLSHKVVLYDVGAGQVHLSEADIERLRENLGLPTRRDKIRWEFDWIVGREIGLTVLAIGGVRAFYFSNRRKPSEA
jgi:hypothetical protein